MDIKNRHLRRRQKVAPTEFYDEQEQDNIIEQFTEQANAQARLYRVLFAVVLVIPSPAFIFAKHCRGHPKLSFLALASLAVSIYTIRSKASRVPILQKLNFALAFLVAVQAWLSLKSDGFKRADILWICPFFAACSSFLLDRWLLQVQAEIKKLADKRYELRGV